MAEHEETFLAAADAEKFAATKHGGQVEHIGVVYVARWDDTATASVGGPDNRVDQFGNPMGGPYPLADPARLAGFSNPLGGPDQRVAPGQPGQPGYSGQPGYPGQPNQALPAVGGAPSNSADAAIAAARARK